MTDRIVDLLFEISTGLLAPTLIILLAMMAGTLILLGGLVRELIDRAVSLRKWREFLAARRLSGDSGSGFYELRLVGYPALYQAWTRDAQFNAVVTSKCLEDLELDMSRRLAWLTFATRVGPMLGLVGTLIPLGPALMGLAAGDIQTLSGNLVIAFTTTVFGILVGGGAFTANLVRKAWYDQDLSDLEYLAQTHQASDAERLNQERPHNGHHQYAGSPVLQAAPGQSREDGRHA